MFPGSKIKGSKDPGSVIRYPVGEYGKPGGVMEVSDGRSPEQLEVERSREKLKGMVPIALCLAVAGAAAYASYQPGVLLQIWDSAMRFF